MIDKTTVLVYNIYVVMSEDITGYMQTYRSGHNGADSKSSVSLAFHPPVFLYLNGFRRVQITE